MRKILSENLRSTLSTAILFLLVLLITFFPVIFQNYTLLPTDLADTMTLPFATDSTHPHANNALTTDGLFQFYPYKAMLREAWLNGRFSFWNPLSAGGYPQYAETMGANFDLLNLVLLVAPMPMSFHLYVLMPLWIAGITMFLFLRAYRVNLWVGRIFATAYMLCGLFITHLLPHAIPGAFCWLPLACLFLKRQLDNPDNLSLIGASIALACGFLGGNIQTAAFLVITIVLYVFLCDSRFNTLRRVSTLVSVGLFAFCLSAIMWFPTLEFFFEVVRHGMIASSSFVRSYSFVDRILSIPLLTTFLLPFVGGPSSGISLYKAINVYTIDFNASLGFFPLLIATWSAFHFRRSKELRPFLVIVLCGILIPIATPLYHYLYHRFLIISLFGLTALGAIGLDRALSDVPSRVAFNRFAGRFQRIFVVICILILIGAACVTIWNQQLLAYLNLHFNSILQGTVFSEGNRQWTDDRIRNTINNFSIFSFALWVNVLTVLIGFAILQTKYHRFDTTMRLKGLWIITAIQCGWYAAWWLAPVSMDKFPLFPNTVMTDILRGTSQRTVFLRLHRPDERYIFIDNENTAYHINAASIFESLLPRSYYLIIPQLLTDSSAPTNLLRRLDVRYVVTPKSSTLPSHDYTLINSERVKTWQVRDTSVRAWIASRSVVLHNDYEVEDSLVKHFEPSVVYFSDSSVPTLNNSFDTNATVTLKENRNESLTFVTNTSHASYLVLSDTYYPGWEATVDGRESTIYRCNYAMRAVVVPAGEHIVRFAFRPLSFRVGALISGATLIALIAGSLFGWPRKIKIRRAHDLNSHL